MENNEKRGRLIGYVRVSTEEQNLDRQLAVMGDVDKLYQDKMSGKNTVDRKGLQQMFADVREGDTIRVKSIDRLARSTRDLLAVLDDMSERGVEVEFIDTPYLNTNKKEGRFFVTILGALAEMERVTIKERQAEGIALAKARGVYDQTDKIALSVEQVAEIRRRFDNGEGTSALAREYGLPRITVYKALKGEGCYGKKAYADIPLPERKFKKCERGQMFSPEQVAEIRMRVANGESTAAVGRDLDVIPNTIVYVCRGKGSYGKGEYADIPTVDVRPQSLTPRQVAEIRLRVSDGESQASLAKEFGVSDAVLHQAVHGKNAYGKGEYADIPVLGVPEHRKSTRSDVSLTPEEVAKARHRYSDGESIDSLYKRFHVHLNTMRNAVFGHGAYGKGEYADIPIPKVRRGNLTGHRNGGPVPALTVEQVAEIRRRFAEGETQTALVEEFGVTHVTMISAIHGKNKYGKGAYAGIPIPERCQSKNPPKLSVEQVAEIRRRVGDGESQHALAAEYGVAYATMNAAVLGKNKYGKGSYAEIPIPETYRGRRPKSA